MAEWIYGILTGIGFHHPLHPALTHLPMGMIIGSFLFFLFGLFMKRPDLFLSARYCLFLALPTAVLALGAGVLDWQYFYKQDWIVPFQIKIVLAPLLVILLCLVLWLQKRSGYKAKSTVTAYLGCLLTIAGLGFFGGEVVYGSRPTAVLESGDPQLDSGAVLFAKHCSRCHLTDSTSFRRGPGLKGLFTLKELPVSKKAVTEKNIKLNLKTPLAAMPKFDQLTEEETEALISYLKTL